MVQEVNGIRVFVDGFSAQYLDGCHRGLRDVDAGLRLHVHQPECERRVRVREQLHRLKRER